MPRVLRNLLLPGLLLLAPACAEPVYRFHGSGRALRYPEARTVMQVDDYHGTWVADPYRWMEDLDSPETRAWVAAENRLTRSYLDRLPGRQAIADRMTELWNYERFGVPVQRGERLFYTRNDGLQDQATLWVQDGAEGEARLLLDPNRFSEDGTVALASWVPSESGELLAYAVADGGSDWREWHVLDVRTATVLEDHLTWSKFSGAAWTHDDLGFFYARYPAPTGNQLAEANHDQSLWYHRVGTPQAADTLIYARPDHPDWGFDAKVSTDGRYLIITGSQGTAEKTRIWYRELKEGAPIRPLYTDFDADYVYLGNRGKTWYFRTDRDAPNGRVVAVDLDHPEPSAWVDLFPETKDALRSAGFYGGHYLVASYLHDAYSLLVMKRVDGQHLPRAIRFQGYGTIRGLSGRPDSDSCYFSYSSFALPASIYHLDLRDGKAYPYRTPQVGFDPADYTVEQVWYTSRDGTRVPMFLAHRKDIHPNGEVPTLLYGYGGFDIPITPSFNVANLVWMEMGGLYAVANIRGGGEFGRAWHEGGMLANKQNVFDDFIAAGEWLSGESGWTRPSRLAIRGGSNGGLLIGACENQRPDLWGACLPAVGVMDMLRFQEFTIGWAWTSDYGSSADPEQFRTLYAYSPYHNVRPGVRYPATLITTGDHDDRVVPAHSFKYAAALQKANGGPNPTLIRIETRAGHGAGKPTSMRIAEYADSWAFLLKALGVASPKALGGGAD